jgi:cytosine permease
MHRVGGRWVKADNPSELYAFATGFLVYLILAKLGVRPPVVELETSKA